MKQTIQIILLLLAAASVTGCATPYMMDRRRDAKDVFTACLGGGYGAKAKVGPLQFGLLFDSTSCGLRGGEVLTSQDTFTGGTMGENLDLLILFVGAEVFKGGKTAGPRGKAHTSLCIASVSMPIRNERFFPPPPRYPFSYFTQIEIVAGPFATIRLGCNPGELLDFILGWTTIDIYNDDLERRKQKEKIEQPDQPYKK